MINLAEVPAENRQHETYPLHETSIRKMFLWLAHLLFYPILRLQVSGLENLPRQGGVVLVANHLSNYDGFVLQFGIPRALFYMGKAELFSNRFTNIFFGQLGAFPVRRGAHDAWALEHARMVLKAGETLAMFPEGTRSKGKGLKVGKTGAARLAIEGGCPIVPVSMEGNQHFFKKFPLRNRVTLKILPPIYPSKKDNPLELTEKIMFLLAEALPPELRGVYAERPPGFDSE